MSKVLNCQDDLSISQFEVLESSKNTDRTEEWECRQCGERIVQEKPNKLLFCSKCETHLRLRSPPQHWLFQFNPSMYNWFEWIRNNKDTEQWLTSQHFKYICEGDLVAIWASGQQAGIYAMGQIVRNPGRIPLNPDQEKYYISEKEVFKFREKLAQS